MRYFYLLFVGLLLTTCLDPTTPEFQLEEPFFLIEGRILAGEEGSEIRIRESAFREEILQFNSVSGARVIAMESGGVSVEWEEMTEEPGAYRPPVGFEAEPGQTWSVEAVLPDGTVIVSDSETIPERVDVTGFEIIFEQNSIFDSGLNRFVPRFELYMDYDDPEGEENFYAYDYRYWEEVIVCATCFRGRYRNGECLEDLSVVPRFDYYCDTDECYRETAGNMTLYGTDELSDGSAVTGFPVGGINFQAYGGLLVEGVLLSITEGAHAYGKVIQDLTTGNAGLNATTPAALVGNTRNTDPEGKTVLGYVGAASAGRLRAFTERTFETGSPIPFDNSLRPEPSVGVFVPPLAPCEIDGRTATRPEGWGG